MFNLNKFDCTLLKLFKLSKIIRYPFSSQQPVVGVCDLYTDDEKMMQTMVSKFATEFISPVVKKMDKQGFMDKSLIDELFKMGLMGIEIPSKYGGSELSFTSSVIAIEELAKVDPSVAILVDIQNTLIVALIKQLGTNEQKEYWLPRLASNTIGSFCLSEAESGSDAFSLRTLAKQDQNDFILNGTKLWISNSSEAELFLVMANVDPTKGYKGITIFLVPSNLPGIKVGKKEQKLGLRASSTCSVEFDHVRVPKSFVLGQIGSGYRYAINVLNEGRIGIGAQMVGLASGCLNYAINYVMVRKQFNQRIWDFQAIQHQIAEVASKLSAARCFLYNTARLKENGYNVQKQASMVKLLTANIAAEITSRSIEWLGGVGFTESYPIEKFYRDVKIGSIYEGTNNIQLNTIAKCIEKEIS